jgi:hypothetical protein
MSRAPIASPHTDSTPDSVSIVGTSCVQLEPPTKLTPGLGQLHAAAFHSQLSDYIHSKNLKFGM